jgi:ribonuclease BN (tRNA processing enzyme)
LKGLFMKITFLGSGSAFCTENFQSNIIIDVDGRKLLFDCGGDIRWALKEKGISLMDIEDIYISHLHADHTGGLEFAAFATYFGRVVQGGKKIKLIAQDQLLRDLWDKSLSGGLSSIQMIDSTLETFFDLVPIQNNGKFIVGEKGYEFDLVQTIHVIADRSFVKSYGLKFHTGKNMVFITSDTQWAPHQLRDFIKSSDVVFHDCETSKFPSGVHAHYEDLVTARYQMQKRQVSVDL